MKTRFIYILFSLIIITLILFNLSQLSSAYQSEDKTLRGDAIELTDKNGSIRAKISIEPGGETVFRLFDEHNTIRVKISASAKGSGIVLLNDSTEVGVQLLANDSLSCIKLVENNKERIIKP